MVPGSIGTPREAGQDPIQAFTKALRPLVRRGEPVLVAVSGGADSLALLDLSARAARSLRLALVVAHLDHAWRADSADDAAFVAAEAERRGLRYTVERIELATRDEASARTARLRFFARAAGAVGAEGVLLGHTADDQAETVLLHLMRGTGARGLGGMRPEGAVEVDGCSLRLLRPLLGFRRADLGAYCETRGLAPRHDPTNADPRYARNRLRAELLPLAEALFPGATGAIGRAAAILAEEAEYVEGAAWAALDELAPMAAPDRIALPRRRLVALPVALQRALLREVGRRLLGPVSELGLERIEAARAVILSGRGGAVVQWPGFVDVRLERGQVIFERRR